MTQRILILTLVIIGLAEVPWAKEIIFSEQEESQRPEQEEQRDRDLNSYILVEGEKGGYVPSQDVITTKVPMPLHVAPISVGVVNEKLFDSQHAEVLGEALRNVSGAVSHTGFGVFDYFVIRGFDSLSNGLVLVDGASEPEATFYHLYNVERVEVLKGPGAYLYGGNPLAGSVNLVRKEPIFENLSRVGGSIGSFGTLRGDVDVNRVNDSETVAFRLNAFGRRSNSYRDSMDNWQAAINPAVSLHLGDKSFLTFNFEFVRNEYVADSGIPIFNNEIADVPRTRSYQSPFDTSDQNVYRTRIDFSTALSSSTVLRNKFYFTALDWETDGTIFAAVLPNAAGSADVFRSLTRLDDIQRLFGNQTELLFSFRSGELGHNLLVGFEVSRLGDEFTLDVAALPSIDVFDPVETAAEPLFNIPFLSQAVDSRHWVAAPYVMDQITVSNRLRILLGGRFDVMDFEDSLNGLERDADEFSPMVGMSFSAFPDLAIYSSFGKAFAAPSSQVIGELEPERSTQFEIGLKKQFRKDQVFFSFAFFNLERDNIAIPDATGITRQQGDQRSRGIELDLAGEISPGLFAFASYAYTDAELTEFKELVDYSFGQLPPILVDRSGNRPAFAPDHVFGLSLIKELNNGMSLGAGARYLSEQFIAESNEFAIDEALILDASFGYRFEDCRVSFNIRNLGGNDYETRGFGSTSVIPGDPFTMYFGFEVIR